MCGFVQTHSVLTFRSRVLLLVSICVCTFVCTSSGSLPRPPPLIFMAPGNPPLIRKSVSPRLMRLIKKLSWWLCAQGRQRWFTRGLNYTPEINDYYQDRDLKMPAVTNQGNLYLAYFGNLLELGTCRNTFGCEEKLWCDMKLVAPG